MDQKTVGLVGAISALAPLAVTTPAEAKTIDEVMSPRSYAELLQPVPNAAALLKELDSRAEAPALPKLQVTQYYEYDPYGGGYGYGYSYYPRRRWHHHHHHHHWNGGGWGYGGGWDGGGGWGGGGYGRRRYYHHHHHHHHHHWNGWW